MKQICLLLPGIVLLVGCSTEKHVAVQPASPPLATPVAFPAPNESQSNQLACLDTLLRSSIANLNLSWVSDMGAVAVPACLHEADEETLPDESRDLAFLVLGNSLRNAGVRENPAAPNDLVVPTLLRGLADPNPKIQRSAAFAARYVDDVRLVSALRQLLSARDFVQEQAVLALGISGHEAEVLPIAELFFKTSFGKFRYSCLYALNTMFLRHDVDVARVLRQNEDDFVEYHLQNVWSVENRFDEFQVIGTIFRGLYSPKESTRHDANEKLRKLTGREARFDPTGDDAARARGIEEWEGYILQDYWGEPPPKS